MGSPSHDDNHPSRLSIPQLSSLRLLDNGHFPPLPNDTPREGMGISLLPIRYQYTERAVCHHASSFDFFPAQRLRVIPANRDGYFFLRVFPIHKRMMDALGNGFFWTAVVYAFSRRVGRPVTLESTTMAGPGASTSPGTASGCDLSYLDFLPITRSSHGECAFYERRYGRPENWHEVERGTGLDGSFSDCDTFPVHEHSPGVG